MQEGRDERPEGEDAREGIEQIFEPPQDVPRHRRLLLPHLRLLQRGDERGEVALHLSDVARERAGGPGEVVGELRRVRAVPQPLEPRLGRAVDPPRHQVRELRVAEEDRVGRARTPARVFSQRRQMVSERPLSLVRLLGTDSGPFRLFVFRNVRFCV